MAAFTPIVFRGDGSYLICCRVSKNHSAFEEYEFIPRELFDSCLSTAKANGEVVEPYINYGLH